MYPIIYSQRATACLIITEGVSPPIHSILLRTHVYLRLPQWLLPAVRTLMQGAQRRK